jgi:hypothetical protein
MKTYLPSEIYRQVSLVPGISCLVPKVAIFIAGSEQRAANCGQRAAAALPGPSRFEYMPVPGLVLY